jgi:hypothetical protein
MRHRHNARTIPKENEFTVNNNSPLMLTNIAGKHRRRQRPQTNHR